MNLPYQIVNHCLLVLQSLELPRVEKLQIEIELLQVKRLILVRGGVSCRTAVLDDDDFETFEAAFCGGCSPNGAENPAELLSLVKNLRATLTDASVESSSLH